MIFKFYNDKTYDYKTRIINESYKNLNLSIMVYLIGGYQHPKNTWKGKGQTWITHKTNHIGWRYMICFWIKKTIVVYVNLHKMTIV
jgi:hypothetical protein